MIGKKLLFARFPQPARAVSSRGALKSTFGFCGVGTAGSAACRNATKPPQSQKISACLVVFMRLFGICKVSRAFQKARGIQTPQTGKSRATSPGTGNVSGDAPFPALESIRPPKAIDRGVVRTFRPPMERHRAHLSRLRRLPVAPPRAPRSPALRR